MASSPPNSVDGALDGSVAPTGENELDQVLDAAQQAWEQGETLLMWVERYPACASELGELALSLERQRLATEPAAEETALAGRSFRRAMETVLGPTKQPDESA